MHVLPTIFWAAAVLVAYAYVIYPCAIWLCARAFGRKVVTPKADDIAGLPAVTLLIAAHDEEAVIAERLDNALAMDYPAGKLRIVVASDGSTDRTAQIVRRFAD